MATTAEFDPRRFRSAAPHYRPGRPDYAALLVRRVARLCNVTPHSAVLDLGCGPGLLAASFAPFAAEVVAMDPEPDMLAEVTALAIPNVRAVRGSSFDLSVDLGRFRLVTMGRSFHWMDGPATLSRLDAMVEPGGAAALFATSHPELPDNAWVADFRSVCRRYAGDDVTKASRRPGWMPHAAVLLESPFNRLETVSAFDRRRVSLPSLVDRALSMSRTAPARLGSRVVAFVTDLEAAIAPHAEQGMITEVVESCALIGFRRGETPE